VHLRKDIEIFKKGLDAMSIEETIDFAFDFYACSKHCFYYGHSNGEACGGLKMSLKVFPVYLKYKKCGDKKSEKTVLDALIDYGKKFSPGYRTRFWADFYYVKALACISARLKRFVKEE